MEDYLRRIIEGVSNTRGEDFFNAISLQLNDAIEADYTFIARLDPEAYMSRTIALVAGGKLIDNIEYSLEDTPCANICGDTICCYPKDVCSVFPDDHLLVEMKIEGYIGTPLHSSKGDVVGLIVALFTHPIENEEFVATLFQLFSGRIEAELERVEYEQRLSELNSSLEKEVYGRTATLRQALEELSYAQEQLIESEKMAALGNLVAGVAHEVNTPLGVAITSHSVLSEHFQDLVSQLDANALTLEQMNEFREAATMALPLIGDNLQRACELVNNFKRIAVDQNQLVEELIELKPYYEKVVSTLRPLSKARNVMVDIDIVPGVAMHTYAGAHAQILTNLIANSVAHGFHQVEAPVIKICSELRDDRMHVHYQDNGCGITSEVRQHIFEPFFTTARAEGGSGLGMSILYNLVTQSLDGNVHLPDLDCEGFCLKYDFPLTKN
mgnify:CR=1 FL=1